MGMSTHIEAFIPDTDAEFQKHKKVLLACLDANISLPEESEIYFGSKWPDLYLLDEKLKFNLVFKSHYVEYKSGDSDGFEIDLSKLPKSVSKIRFYNSW